MHTMTWIFLIALIITFTFLFIFHIQYQKHLKQKDKKANQLVKSLQSLERKLNHDDRRKALRVKILSEELCHFQLTQFGDHTLNHLVSKRGKGIMYDISHTGLSMTCDIDLPVRKQIYLQVQFHILGEEFDLYSVMRRKCEEMNGEIQYGIKFLEMDFMDKKQLAAAIQNYEIHKIKRA